MANFSVPYEIEREGQIEFFKTFGIPYEEDASVLVDNTDGVYNGNIFEFKLNISNLNKVLFQAIKYLSKMRVKGESVPATILLVDLNATTVYVYKSADYREDIHKIYIGASSKDVSGFTAKNYSAKYDYSTDIGAVAVQRILRPKKSLDEEYLPIDIDENCIVGWAERYYSELPKANKGDFLGDDNGTAVKVTGEIREPRHFKGLINPYKGKSNEKFKYLMDCLNDRLSKKDLGAFYTPMPYARKASELVQMAIERVPEGNDYIILDRCAGTGNLESALIGLYDRNGDELISHCVVSTYEYYEYKVLQERIGDKVRNIIPPTEKHVDYANGKVANADAMSEEYIKNPIIRQYVDNPKCTIILFENPPFHDETTGAEKRGKEISFVLKNMKLEIKGVATNELANRFIWSAFKYFIKKENDCYIVFAPIKYWKLYDLMEAKFCKGYIFDREYFHATASSTSCILWTFGRESRSEVYLDVEDIKNEKCIRVKSVIVKKVFQTISKLYSKVKFSDKNASDIYCNSDGTEAVGKKIQVKSYYTDDVIAYLEADSFTMDPMHRGLVRLCLFRGHGCYLTVHNYFLKLPIWVAKYVPLDNWYEKDIYATTSDGGDAYTKNADFLKSCLIYTCLSNQNKCLTFDGSDGRHYQNELCFDNGTLASKDLAGMRLDNEERALMDLWYKILAEAKQMENYNPAWTYGVYQITRELNTFKVVGTGKNKKKVYDCPVLNGDLDTLRTKLKEYYKSHITEKMFKYELLK